MKPKIKRLFGQMSVKKTQRTQLPVSLRTNVSEIFYKESVKLGRTKPLEQEPYLQEWSTWALIENSFPYDAVFKLHHMLIPKRVVKEEDLNNQERSELTRILRELGSSYDCYMVNFTSKQSLRSHYHVHLMVYKDTREELRLR